MGMGDCKDEPNSIKANACKCLNPVARTTQNTKLCEAHSDLFAENGSLFTINFNLNNCIFETSKYRFDGPSAV